jgi:hypothetical protein
VPNQGQLDESVAFYAKSAVDECYTAIVKNLRTGDVFTESVESGGYFAAACADLSRKAVIGVGDQVEVAVIDSSGNMVSGRLSTTLRWIPSETPLWMCI